VRVRFCDELDVGFGWIVDEFLLRCSHALVAGGRVWVIDPVDGEEVEERIRVAGEPAGVIQLLDRHNRDCVELAARLGVPLHKVPRQLAEAPFELIGLRTPPFWDEVALWWAEPRVLVCGDAFETAPYVRVAGERIAVHPLLRLFPPKGRLGRLEPRHVLCGHGEGVHGDEAAPALREALATARRRMPRAWLQGIRAGAKN
jgi:hypothetical protein